MPLSSNSIIWFLGATGIRVGIVIIFDAILPSPCSLFPVPCSLFPVPCSLCYTSNSHFHLLLNSMPL
ncbi:MAG: hypothetical protein F6K55_09910 [Moorea sp. SIO4A3]|nr:hypothetical protein [Moorena sp. SIO4A3]